MAWAVAGVLSVCVSLKVSLDHWLLLTWLAFSSVGTGDLVSLGLLNLPRQHHLGQVGPAFWPK